MPQFTPAMVKLFTDKEKLVNSYPMTYITNPEKEIIYAVVSAANNCEMCLSFHAMGMGQTLSPEDCKLIVDGGLPTQNERARTIAIAAKYAICHKGLLLEREAAHLESMGVSKEMYGEILFLCGQIHASTCVAIKFRGASRIMASAPSTRRQLDRALDSLVDFHTGQQHADGLPDPAGRRGRGDAPGRRTLRVDGLREEGVERSRSAAGLPPEFNPSGSSDSETAAAPFNLSIFLLL